jgi:hypothetical protein
MISTTFQMVGLTAPHCIVQAGGGPLGWRQVGQLAHSIALAAKHMQHAIVGL